MHHDGGQIQSTLVNLELYLKEGDPAGNPLIYPGDTLKVTYQKTQLGAGQRPLDPRLPGRRS